MVTPISASAVMLRRWTSPSGVSRATSTSLRRSLRVTSAARRSRFSAYPWQMPASVFMLHGTTAMPSVSKVPLAMAAPMLPMSCVRKASPARSVPLMPVSSCRTRSPASLVTRWTSQSFSLRMASSSETHRIAPLAPLNPTTRRFFMVLSFWRKRWYAR